MKSDCIYHTPIDLESNGRQFCNRCIVNTVWFRFDLIRFRKDFSVCRRCLWEWHHWRHPRQDTGKFSPKRDSIVRVLRIEYANWDFFFKSVSNFFSMRHHVWFCEKLFFWNIIVEIQQGRIKWEYFPGKYSHLIVPCWISKLLYSKKITSRKSS